MAAVNDVHYYMQVGDSLIQSCLTCTRGHLSYIKSSRIFNIYRGQSHVVTA